jgi:hypothetical protein
MRLTVLALSLLGALGAAACSGNDQASTAAATGSTTAAAPTVTATAATATASTKASAAPKPRKKAPRSYESLKAELAKKCPIEDKPNNVEQKEAVANAGDCLRRKMIADLDAVLLPLKKAEEPKFKALMKEQAEWNRHLAIACELEEERFWVDLVTGARDDGTLRGYTYLGCLDKAYTERILFARSLAAKDDKLLVKRVDDTQKDGAATKEALAQLQKTAEAFVLVPPKVEEPFQNADWKAIGESSGKVGAAAASMAKSTCETWAGLAKALGGKEACETKVELYYAAQFNTPSPI